VIGVEVKAAETVRGEDFRGLRHLANRLGGRFRAGIVLYAGEQQLSFGDRLDTAQPTVGRPPTSLPADRPLSTPRPGRFLLTGSARLLGLRDLPDALPGRAETIELWPLSQGKLGARFRAGIVLYAGEQQLSFGDRLTALPMAALWMLESSAP
jgi:hypothetical protein